jgi:hypothetical protein
VKLKTLLLVPLLIIGLGYVGTKGYIYFKTKERLDKFIRMASPLVQIDYTDVGSELSGKIHINNVTVTPTGTYDEVSIKQLSLSGKGFTFLLDLAGGFENNNFPSQMEIIFDKLQSPVSSSLINNITSTISKTGKKRQIQTCSIPGILNAVGLKELEIPTITLNGKMGYMFDKEASQADFVIKYDLSGIESTLIEMSISQLPQQVMTGLGKLPVIDKFRMVRQYRPEYIKQIVSYCSTETSLAASAFIDDLFTQSDNYYLKSLGFVPGPGLSDLFRQLITNAGTVEITASPSSEISPVLLKAYRPEDLIDLFGVTATYNGKPITDLSFSMQSSTTAYSRQPKPKASSSYPTAVVAAPTGKPQRSKPRPKLRYLDTKVSDLGNYLNYKVRAFTLNNEKPKSGMLISIVNNTINIEHLLLTGKMTSHLHKDRIERIEVLRKENNDN